MESESEKGVGWQNEPDPTMRSLNPFTQARNQGMRKQSEIAAELGIETTEIIRLEQAIFDRVSPNIVQYYTEMLGMPKAWQAGYRSFQRLIRQSAPRPIHGVWQMPPGELTFRRWRLHNWPTMSQMSWCKAFCIHPASLYAIEKGEKDRVPSQILSALIEAHVFSDEQARMFAFKVRQAHIAQGKLKIDPMREVATR